MSMLCPPAKINHGDPLFEAATEHCFHSPPHNDHNDNDNNNNSTHQDPIFMDLMIHCPKSALPLHSYYSEFRLGQGDPLMKAAMKRWPFTTISDDEDEEEEEEEEEEAEENKEMMIMMMGNNKRPRTRALAIPPCHVLSDPSLMKKTSPTKSSTIRQEILHVDNVGHVEDGGRAAANVEQERRFILMSEDRRFVLVE